ncbi:MAG: 5'-nucleotidase C-terminal domain-containing protein [Saprospiraceae bacterium]
MSAKQYLLFLPLLLLFACTKVLHLAETKPANYRIDADAKITEDPAIKEMIQPYKKQLDAEMNAVIGEVALTLSKAKPESTLGNWTADAIQKKCTDYYQQPIDFSIVNYGGLRIPNVRKGSISKGKVFELMPFDNMLVVLQLDGQTVLQFFDHMASNGGWPISRGVTYQISGEKATEVLVNGKSIDPQKMYKIGMSDYIANGGDRCAFFKDKKRDQLGKLFRDALLEYVEEQTAKQEPLSAAIEGRVKLAE